MGEITREDLKIILAFALHVAKVDHEFANMEKVIIKRFVEVSHIEQEELAQLASTRISLADCLGRMSGDEAKSLLVQTMCAVAHCDGVTKDVESEFINRVNQSLENPIHLRPQDSWGEYENEVMSILQFL